MSDLTLYTKNGTTEFYKNAKGETIIRRLEKDKDGKQSVSEEKLNNRLAIYRKDK